jgi:hypothetical protein
LSFDDFREINHRASGEASFVKAIGDGNIARTWENEAIGIPCCSCISMIRVLMTGSVAYYPGETIINARLASFPFSGVALKSLLRFGIVSRDDVQSMIDVLSAMLDDPSGVVMPEFVAVRLLGPFSSTVVAFNPEFRNAGFFDIRKRPGIDGRRPEAKRVGWIRFRVEDGGVTIEIDGVLKNLNAKNVHVILPVSRYYVSVDQTSKTMGWMFSRVTGHVKVIPRKKRLAEAIDRAGMLIGNEPNAPRGFDTIF